MAKTKKRKDYLSWDDYFMAIALLSAERSKDPSTQVGACIVSPDKKVVGVGYNGFPTGCSDDELPWEREAKHPNDTKYPYVCHAELNAIINAHSRKLDGCTLYVCLYPCNECAKAVIQAGIKEVVYLSDKYAHVSSFQASKRMFKLAKIKTRQHTPSKMTILLNHGKHLDGKHLDGKHLD